ncbi:alkaline phosphatase D family protein [Sphingomonas sp.]|uniref:alkaline phosphatase D family protein n=1 Tax=Sphingomonas sp. TaxID=28214 RepID=UPI002CA9EFFF|nr:alkaline phosphatase D family protein [Sphingomonas sp.]HWK35465.1 alkaline phosphatase D family protein [Sphingomonas sp.]
MTTILTRRFVLEGGLASLGLFALPLAARAAAPAFTHGVASGDPKQDRVTLWTRCFPADGTTARVRVEVAQDPGFRRRVAADWGVASPDNDYCVKIVATGLQPGSRYHYRFIGPDGATSPVGRTRTLPARGSDPFRVAVLSCANMDFGYFNAYRHLAGRSDIDLVLHLGDYIYEWGNGTHSLAAQALKDRISRPSNETVTLDDYRTRYAWYRADPDLAEMHRMLPIVSIVDDHEVANNSWRDGAGNHQPNEGSYQVRKAAAMKAYHEWLPMPDTPYDRYDIGDLAAIFRLDTRLLARDEPPSLNDALAGAADPIKAMAAFRDGVLQDPRRQLLGEAQERWLADGLARSVNDGQRWQILSQQVIMAERVLPQAAARWARTPPAPGSKADLRQQLALASSRAGLPLSLDDWNGYPAARARVLAAAQAARANLVVLAGDSHNAWASDLVHDGRPAGVEYAGQSVASLGIDGRFDADPAQIAADMIAANPTLKWCDTSRRGYMTVTLTHDAARADWVMLDTVARRSTDLAGTASATAGHGARALAIG